MEGKGVLFKKFAGIDVFDIELNEKNLDKLVDASRLASTLVGHEMPSKFYRAAIGARARGQSG